MVLNRFGDSRAFVCLHNTAEYVARQLREALPGKIRVESVTGLLPPAERKSRIEALVEGGGECVLVCTDCLSEGVNLQQNFNAVFHYDLCWNPTRHEQREGRVDRFGQENPEVRVITYLRQGQPCRRRDPRRAHPEAQEHQE